MWIADNWKDYEVLDTAGGEKLERWGNTVLRRPDPQAMWNVEYNDLWKNPDAFYHRSNKGGGYWDFDKKLPEFWTVSYYSD